jgi:hypothetical protein
MLFEIDDKTKVGLVNILKNLVNVIESATKSPTGYAKVYVNLDEAQVVLSEIDAVSLALTKPSLVNGF